MITKRSVRKAQRHRDNDALAREARFWLRQRSADRMAYDKPINRQAARELSHKRKVPK